MKREVAVFTPGISVSMSDKRATANTEPKRMVAISGRSFKQVRFCYRRGKRNFAERSAGAKAYLS